MVRDDQLIFYIAVPGSGWAKLSLLLGCCAKLNLNKSDRRPDREERGKQGDCGVVFHKGAFWDPMREFGNGFDDNSNGFFAERRCNVVSPKKSEGSCLCIRSYTV